MSLENEQIKEQFEHISSRFGPKTIVPGRVIAINEDDTIEVQFSDDSIVDDCRLKAVVKDGNKVLLIPAVDSIVLVGRIENSDEFIVVAVDEVSKMLMVVGSKKFELTSAGFLIASGDDTLKDVISLVIQAVQAVVVMQGRNPDYIKLQQAVTKLNNIMQ